MRPPAPRLLAASALAAGALAACVPAQSQTLRERLQSRVEQRQAQAGDAAPTGRAGRAGRGAAVPAGVEERTLIHDGLERRYYVRVPSSLDASPGAVLAFHGGTGSAAGFVGRNGTVNAAADRGGFLAVYPDAVDGTWTDGRIGTAGGPDDVGFARAVVADLQAAYGLDPSRVFATGISNGGMMVHRLACEAPDLVAGIAPVAANLPEALMARCAPSSPTPVAMFSGTADPLMPYQGGRPERDRMLRRANGPAQDTMTSAPDTAAFWARVNGCGGASETELPDAASDGTTVTAIAYDNCAGAEVRLYRVNGGGHTWPGGGGEGSRIAGTASRDIDATATMVNFFARYGL